MKFGAYREKGVQWWVRIGKFAFCGKHLTRAKLLFSERNGHKPSIKVFGWLLFIDNATS